MAAVVDNLFHNMSTNIVGCCDMCLLGKLASKHAPTMAAGFQAVVLAASTPNRLLLRVRRFETSWWHDACWR